MTDTPTPNTATPRSPSRGWGLRWLLVGIATLLTTSLLAGMGPDHGPIVGLSAVIGVLVGAAGPVFLYILASAGLGIAITGPLKPQSDADITRDSTDRTWLALAIGLAAMLTLSHALGWAGLFTTSAAGRAATFAPIVGGIGFLALWWARHIRSAGGILGPALRTLPRLRLTTIASTIGVSVLLVASCSTPGLLWESEFRGFDAFAYHLELPKEWLARGRIEPLEHNVYSYLPSYLEAAYTHIGALGAPIGRSVVNGRPSMLAGAGDALIACQLLHAAITLLAAGLIGRLCDTAAEWSHLSDRARRAARMTGWAATLATPWNIVTGSLAYNEMGVVALGAAAMLIALSRTHTPFVRGTLSGFLVGAACSCKPTAIFMVAPVTAICLIARTSFRRWHIAFGCCALAGLLTLAPWLLRNWIHGANPFFPHLASIFGPAHWSPEQLTRYAAAHRGSGSLLQRLSLLILPASGDPSAPGATVQRGLLHPQFFALPWLVLLAAIGILFSRWRRRLAAPAIVMSLGLLIQLLGWTLLTHQQSRFLIPILLTAIPLVGLAAAMASSERSLQKAAPSGGSTPRRRSINIRRALLAATIDVGLIIQAVWLIMLFAQQGRGSPNQFLVGPRETPGSTPTVITPAVLTGETFRAEWASSAGAAHRQIESDLSSEAYVNLVIGAQGGITYLLGDSAPLYFTAPILYHSTYDRSPLGELIRAHPGNSDVWARTLWDAGIRHILLNHWELARLHERSHWYDPVVSPERAATFLNLHATPVRDWPEVGRTLYRLMPPANASAEGGS
jgi:hypothetical protein